MAQCPYAITPVGSLSSIGRRARPTDLALMIFVAAPAAQVWLAHSHYAVLCSARAGCGFFVHLSDTGVCGAGQPHSPRCHASRLRVCRVVGHFLISCQPRPVRQSLVANRLLDDSVNTDVPINSLWTNHRTFFCRARARLRQTPFSHGP